jgi:hypothetical protein
MTSEIFEEVYAIVHTMRVAWRNPSLHVEKEHNREESDRIFNAVKALCRSLPITSTKMASGGLRCFVSNLYSIQKFTSRLSR